MFGFYYLKYYQIFKNRPKNTKNSCPKRNQIQDSNPFQALSKKIIYSEFGQIFK